MQLLLGKTTPDLEKKLPGPPSLEFLAWLVTRYQLTTNRSIRVGFDLLARELTKIVQKMHPTRCTHISDIISISSLLGDKRLKHNVATMLQVFENKDRLNFSHKID